LIPSRINQNISGRGNTQSHQEVHVMKKFWIMLIVAMFGLVLACGSKEEKAPAKTAAPPAKAEKVVPPAAPAPQAPTAAPAPSAPVQPKPEHPKSEHPK
jgi:hypothetical protein